jgi:formylglycine-generating enzyme required for sulfatase activity
MSQFTIDRTTTTVQTFSEDLGDGISLDLVLIPPGKFLMGSPLDELERQDSEGPQHEVTIVQPFLMGQSPVTQAQWAKVVKMTQVKRSIEQKSSSSKGDDFPVERVSWLDAEEFCLRLSNHTKRIYRLPSEAEWEYACRAGTTTAFHFGETIDATLANYQAQDNTSVNWPGKYGRGILGEYCKKTTPIKTFPANSFGLYDMHGNVWEWCLDSWYENYDDAPTDGSARDASNDSGFKILRGGSWFNNPGNCRSAYRDGDAADDRYNNDGFRVVYSSSRILS